MRIEVKTVLSGEFDWYIVRLFDHRAHERVILLANCCSWCADTIEDFRLWVVEPLN